MTRAIPVLEFVTAFHPGGTERQFVNLVAGLAPEFEPHVACFHAEGALLQELPAGLPVHEIGLRSLRSTASIGRLVSLARYLKEKQIAIVHATGLYPNVFGIGAAKMARTPVAIASVRDLGHMWSAAQVRAQRFACRFADAVVANSEAVARRLRGEGYDARRIDVIRNGVDQAFRPLPVRTPRLRADLGIEPDAPVVATVCRLHPLKGLEDFLAAAAIVAKRHPRVRFLVVGGPPKGYPDDYGRTLRSLADRLGIGGRVAFTGCRSDVGAIYAETTVAVLSSLSEGLSNAVLEAMSAAVPVVATDVGGNPEVVEHGVTGFLVPPGSATALALAIGELLDAPEKAAAMGRAGRQRLHASFTRERMTQETKDLYFRLLDRAARRRPEVAAQRNVGRAA